MALLSVHWFSFYWWNSEIEIYLFQNLRKLEKYLFWRAIPAKSIYVYYPCVNPFEVNFLIFTGFNAIEIIVLRI